MCYLEMVAVSLRERDGLFAQFDVSVDAGESVGTLPPQTRRREDVAPVVADP